MITLEQLNRDAVYYFASPYSSTDQYIRELRYLQAVKVATELINDGFTLIEPIAMSHQHSQRFGLPGNYAFWRSRDRKFIERCDAVIICMLDGWRESIGVADEEAYALDLGKPVYYLNPSTMELEAKVSKHRCVMD